MNQEEFKQNYVLKSIGLHKDIFNKIYTFIDFGNVNYWFKKDKGDVEDGLLNEDENFEIDLEKISEFLKYFSEKEIFYYGINPNSSGSVFIISKAREYFKVKTKQMQKTKSYLDIDGKEFKNTDKDLIQKDGRGYYVRINKCNFDVEIAIDAIKFIDRYNTFCIMSGDSDFIELFKYLKQKKKKIILIKKGFVVKELEQLADLVVSAQDIKKYITFIKCKNPAV